MSSFSSEEDKNVYSEFLRRQEELVIRLPEANRHAEHAMRSFGDTINKIAESAARESHLYGSDRAVSRVVLTHEINVDAYESIKSNLHFILKVVVLGAFEDGYKQGLLSQDGGTTNG